MRLHCGHRIRLIELATGEVDDPRYAANGPDRCYHCKDTLYAAMGPLIEREGLVAIVDGYNADDAYEFLAGRAAAERRGVHSPLYEAGITKAEVRDLLRAMGLAVADKPASACLASRIPTGTAVTRDVLAQIEQAERLLHGLGIARSGSATTTRSPGSNIRTRSRRSSRNGTRSRSSSTASGSATSRSM